MVDVQPEKLFVSVGGHFGTYYQIALNKGQLSYTQACDDYEQAPAQIIVPDSKQWRSFWKRVDAIGVWNWESRYENPSVMDGTSWHVEIAHNDKNVSSSGSNDYPNGDATIAFEPFLKAVRELIGDRPFC